MWTHRNGKSSFMGPPHKFPPEKRGQQISLAGGQKKWFFAGMAAFLALMGGGAVLGLKGGHAREHYWSQAVLPRVCDYDHDGVEDFEGSIGTEHSVSWDTVTSGATFEPLCDVRTHGCLDACVTIAKPARVYKLDGQALVISDADGRLLKRIGK